MEPTKIIDGAWYMPDGTQYAIFTDRVRVDVAISFWLAWGEGVNGDGYYMPDDLYFPTEAEAIAWVEAQIRAAERATITDAVIGKFARDWYEMKVIYWAAQENPNTPTDDFNQAQTDAHDAEQSLIDLLEMMREARKTTTDMCGQTITVGSDVVVFAEEGDDMVPALATVKQIEGAEVFVSAPRQHGRGGLDAGQRGAAG